MALIAGGQYEALATALNLIANQHPEVSDEAITIAVDPGAILWTDLEVEGEPEEFETTPVTLLDAPSGDDRNRG